MVDYSPMNVVNFASLLESKNDNLIVKNIDNKYIIKYNKNLINKSNIKSLGLFRSIITDKDGKIISFAPPKSMYFDTFVNENNP